MPTYISLLQFTEQGVHNVKETTKRAAAAMAEAEKTGAKISDVFWTMGAYDLALVIDAPNDETASALALKVASQGNVRGQTMRAFRKDEMEKILGKIK
jgi:uncharacterized protein with GYD domain